MLFAGNNKTSTTNSEQHRATDINKRYFKWIDRRSPLAKSTKLTRNNMYILPSKTGLLFTLLCFLLWLIGTSYQNNLILALCYFLASVMIVCVLHTYANLASLTISAIEAKPAFVDEQVQFSLKVSNYSDRPRYNIKLRWQKGKPKSVNVAAQSSEIIVVTIKAKQRGYLTPRRLLVESVFPLGILRCWTWVNMDIKAIVYPKPVHFVADDSADWQQQLEEGESLKKGDEFAGIRPYRPGDPIKHIAWKHYARGQGLNSKEYLGVNSKELILDWLHFSYLPFEQRLSALCYWVLTFDKLGAAYGLHMPNQQIKAGIGDAHRHQLLFTLATYQVKTQQGE